MRFYAVVITFCIALGDAGAQDVKIDSLDRLPFLDATQGFQTLRDVNIFRSYDEALEIFYAFPSNIVVREPAFRYQVEGGRITGVLSAIVILGLSNQAQEAQALEVLRQRYANASMQTLAPTEGRFFLQAWGEQIRLNAFGTTILPFQPITLEATIEEPLSRVLLRDISSASNIFGLTLRYAVKGVELNQDAKPVVAERTYTMGRTFGVSCVSTPERFVNVRTGDSGCLFGDSLTSEKARRIQIFLAELGYYRAPVDGIVGPKTKIAIQNFEIDSGREPEGVASTGTLIAVTLAYKKRFCEQENVDPTNLPQLCATIPAGT